MYQHGGDIYNNKIEMDFSSNVNLIGIPEGIVRAAKRGVELSYRYPDSECNQLREAISNNEAISKDMIICGNGAAELIFSLVIAKKPRKALLLSPTFHEYEQALLSMDCDITYHLLSEEQGFELQKDFIDGITKDIDIVFICNPNNPTGVLIERSLMESILKKCEDCKALLVVDECFMDFVSERKDYTIKEYCKSSKNLFVLKAFTKLYAMPGLRLGYGFCGDSLLLDRMKNTSQPWSVSIPAQMAGVAAMEEKEYIKASLNMIEKERSYFIQQLQELNSKVYGSKANYIFFKSEEGLYKACLKQSILIRDCSNYRGLSDGFYRVVVKTHNENKALIKVLKQLG